MLTASILRILLPACILSMPMVLLAQVAPAVEWHRCYGGTGSDGGAGVTATADGGYIMMGSTQSNDGDVSFNNGISDMWVVKVDALGDIEWERAYGGWNVDIGSDLLLTTDGGYLVLGRSGSDDGDIVGFQGESDLWLLKLDAAGSIEWQRCLGGTLFDYGTALKNAPDGGSFVAGVVNSNDGDVSAHHGGSDGWVVKLDAFGEILWQRPLGGSGADSIADLVVTASGGVLATGATDSNDGDVSCNQGGSDMWVMELDPDGNLLWQRCLGGTGNDQGMALTLTSDNNIVITGSTFSNNGDVTGHHGEEDMWLVLLSPAGDLLWQKPYGGSGSEYGHAVEVRPDGGFILAGRSNSTDGDASGNQGDLDAWVIRTDGLGELLWQGMYGGSGLDAASNILPMPNGGYTIIGDTRSNDGDVSGLHGMSDLWLVELAVDPVVITSPLAPSMVMDVFPNPAEGTLFISFALDQPSRVSLSWLDGLGKKVRSEQSGLLIPGPQQVAVNAEDLARGCYFLRINADEHSAMTRVVLW